MILILFGSVQMIQMQQIWHSKCPMLVSLYPNLSDENPLGIQCRFRGSGKGQITCLLAHCHLFSSQFERVL